eukprot:613600-Prymnesium_polylepis.1
MVYSQRGIAAAGIRLTSDRQSCRRQPNPRWSKAIWSAHPHEHRPQVILGRKRREYLALRLRAEVLRAAGARDYRQLRRLRGRVLPDKLVLKPNLVLPRVPGRTTKPNLVAWHQRNFWQRGQDLAVPVQQNWHARRFRPSVSLLRLWVAELIAHRSCAHVRKCLDRIARMIKSVLSILDSSAVHGFEKRDRKIFGDLIDDPFSPAEDGRTCRNTSEVYALVRERSFDACCQSAGRTFSLGVDLLSEFLCVAAVQDDQLQRAIACRSVQADYLGHCIRRWDCGLAVIHREREAPALLTI